MFADDAPDADLIETLWNVKCRFSGYFPSAHPGFNRDIVECKVEPVGTAVIWFK